MRLVIRPGATIATLVALAILIGLGDWQLRRLEWKNELIAKTTRAADLAGDVAAFDDVLAQWRDGADTEYRAVALRGRFAHDQERHVFGAVDGKPGYFVFTPLIRDGAPIVMVNRGFVPEAVKSAARRKDGLIESEVRVTGLFRAPEEKQGLAARLQPENDPDANRWYLRDPLALARDLDVVPVYVDSAGAENPGAWPKGGLTRLDFTNRHLEYALTWFGLAFALAGVWAAFSIRKDS